MRNRWLIVSIVANLFFIVGLIFVFSSRSTAESSIVVAGDSQIGTGGLTQLNPTATGASAYDFVVAQATAERATATAFAIANPTQPPPTAVPPTPTTEQIEEAEPTPLATNTPVPEPTATPEPTAIPEPTAVPGPEWLAYLNLFRAEAGLSPVTENVEWSANSLLHSQYMVEADDVSHHEDSANPNYSDAGAGAAKGNISASPVDATERWSIDFWMSAPFHILPILRPHLEEVGYGRYLSGNGDVHMAGTLEVHKGLGEPPSDDIYPIYFPSPDGQTWIVRHSLFEFPEPWKSCPGFPEFYGAGVSGPPIVLQLGSGDITPQVTQHSVEENGVAIPHCIFDETTYSNSAASFQKIGRIILDKQDAIIIMPRNPLTIGSIYTVNIEVNGELYSWNFEAVNPPG